MTFPIRIHNLGIPDSVFAMLEQALPYDEATETAFVSLALSMENQTRGQEEPYDIHIVFESSVESFCQLQRQDTLFASLYFSRLPPIELCELFTALLSARFQLTSALKDNIRTALHEAMLNAIIHGNLGIVSEKVDDLDAMQLHFEIANQRLRHAKYRQLPIEMEIHLDHYRLGIALKDQGRGFVPYTANALASEQPHGKGMAMIACCASGVEWDEGGRRICMWFNADEPLKPAGGKRASLGEEPLTSARILIIDDSEMQCMLIRKILESKGFHNFDVARDGEEGVQKTYLFRPDLVILDLLMPRVDGFHYCRRIRADAIFQDLPIVVQTIISQPEQRMKAFEAGATDLVLKPLNLEELLARTLLHLEQRSILKKLKAYQKQIQKELDDAREMQRAILPDAGHIASVERQYGIMVHAQFQPSLAIGGDYWSMKPLSPHHLMFYMVDFSGHGVQAALNTFRLQALMAPSAEDPAAQLGRLNRLLRNLLQPGQYATMFLGILDISEDILTYASAGAPPAVHMTGSKLSLLSSTGSMLGADSASEYTSNKLFFPPGDALMIYSDALVETPDGEGNYLTEEHLLKMLRENLSEGPSWMFQHLKQFFMHHHAPQLRDDLTLNLYARRKGR